MKITLLVVAVLSLTVGAAQAQAPTYRLARTASVGGEGSWDYLSVDHAGGRLYASHGTQVEVLDLTTLQKVGNIPNTPRVHGVLVVPAHKRGFVSCGGNNTVVLFDPATLRVTGTVLTGTKPDAMLYDAFSDHVFVFNNAGSSATVLDAASGQVVGTAELNGAPEAGATDGAGTIFVNLEDKNEVVAFDAKTLQVKSRWPLGTGEEPTGLGYDGKMHRLFSACNKQVVVLDSRSGKVLSTVPSGAGSDGLALDESRHLAFVSNGGDGTMTVIRTDAQSPVAAAPIPTALGARTIALDAVTHHLYLPTAELGPIPAATAEVPHPRPSIVPGTFRILEVAPTR
jgi:DNA-binding beta-propeller fold protein YncE